MRFLILMKLSLLRRTPELTGLYAGIYGLSASTTNTINVCQSQFTDNSYGVRLNAVNNATITQDTFDIGTNIICPNFTGIGIEINNCNGYKIEENNFKHSEYTNQGDNYVGIRVIGQSTPSQVTYNEIYRNTFHGINTGNQAEQSNYNNNLETGLCYICNKNANNTYDFNIKDYGVDGYQGSYSLPAGNVFSKNANNPYSDFNNQATWGIVYNYYNGNSAELPVSVYGLTPSGTPHQNMCPSNFGNNGGAIDKLTGGQISDLQQTYAYYTDAYNNTSNLFETLKDGGSTSGLNLDITASTPDQTMELRDELLGKSPHLSEEILKAAAAKTEVLPDPILFEILAANPDELRNGELLTYLQEKSHPLPDYMIDLLSAIASDSSYKTTLQSELSFLKAESMKASSSLVRDILLDSTMDYINLRSWLDNQHNMSADCQIVDSWLQEKNTTAALALLDLIPQVYSMDSSTTVEYNYFKDLKTFQANLISANTNLFGLDSTEVSFLENIASNSQGLAGLEAGNILEFGYGISFINCGGNINAPVKRDPINKTDLYNKIYEPKVSVLPTPAKSWAAFNYQLFSDVSNSSIRITDMNNVEIRVIPLTQLKGQVVLDTREMQSGLYIYTINNGNYSKSGKLLIAH